jgi:uncharacterized protein (TIGR00375 family)
MSLQSVYADLHIHIGRTESGLPVKVTAARDMTFANIIKEAHYRKGIRLIGIIDAHSPPVQEEIRRGIASGTLREHPDGGIVYEETVCILGAEIEVKEPGMGPAHLLAYFSGLETMERFTGWCSRHMKNVQLSTQRLHRPVRELQEKVEELGGLLIPAHVFTPFKSLYGSATDRMARLLDPDKVAAVELGLSSDSEMADHLSELASFTFVTNSDAHSLPKIGREYNELLVAEPSFKELERALKREDGRRVVTNYGLNPRLGKYYRTRCLDCGELWMEEAEVRCPHCGSRKKVTGVRDRILSIADQPSRPPDHRPPYVWQVPLEFIPGLGKKTLDKLLDAFGTEMDVLHRASVDEIACVAGADIARQIGWAREGRLKLEEGGGGVYGRVKRE